MKNVISYSLWGENPLYINGAIRNAKRYGEFYPGWVCRFYLDDTVAPDVVKQLEDSGAEIRHMRKTAEGLGMYWRFHPMFDDQEIDRFIVRDTDSFFTEREVFAVNEWIESSLPFHIIRDNEVHAVQILGGTWGAVAGCIPDFERKISIWFSQLQPMAGNPRGLFHGSDQNFLARGIWPIIKDRHMAHVRAGMDHLKYTPDDRELPPIEPAEGYPDGHYVGMVF